MANLGSMTTPRRPLERASAEPQLFETLLELKWRNIGVPIWAVRKAAGQSLVEHEYYGRNVANVENTGRKSRRFDVTIPFYNGQAAGRNESWAKEPLFPTTYFKFLKALEDRSDGDLQHPIHGTVKCKSHEWSEELDADHRSGVLLHASFIEQYEEDDVRAIRVRTPDFDGIRAAIELDASMDDLREKVPSLPVFQESFETALRRLSGLIDGAVLRAQLLAHKPEQILSNVNRLLRSLDRARLASNAPAIDACERLREAILGMANAGPKRKPVKRHRTKVRTTLAMVANSLKASADDIATLNPQYLKQLEVPAGSVILYYA